jgi:hypothetical protein
LPAASKHLATQLRLHSNLKHIAGGGQPT